MSQLEGKTALVTGGARGFGRALALMFAAEGADVAVADLARDLPSERFYAMGSPDQLERTADEVRALGRRSLALRVDVTSSADCERMAEETLREFGQIDVLVANAGVWSVAKPWEFGEDEWDLVVDVNLKGAWLTTKFVVPHMIERRYGKVLLVSSVGGLRAYPGYASYIAAKHGVIGLMKSLALELGPYDVNVNAICPTQMGRATAESPVDPAWPGIVGHDDPTYEEYNAAAGKSNLFEHRGLPDFPDVAEVALWLVSDASRMVTGQAIGADAGWLVKRGG